MTEITENGVKYLVDVENGQKTGFFLDQKYNRRQVAKLARGKRVLDCFTHTGSFALNAALGGAEHVTAVDVSQAAVDLARDNAVLNGWRGAWTSSAPTSLICCPLWSTSRTTTLSSWTRPPSPSPERRRTTPCGGIRRSTTGP